ncbi:hypothetical protein NLI96_g1370 [Meripilus lineatus]|uniref:Phosphatidylglycerol/phosphatidylinositol transfer protein n=1 Tax=Meripilus lineatus TaxID=2056292 RepID=A0AAD5YN08_9APHY|nr:hypothetical protein NLI96_g1370 [Physisporinus lineatus]
MARFAYFTLLVASIATLCAAISVPIQEPLRDDGLAPDKKKWGWEDCGDDDFPMHVTSLEISPDPPKPGEELTVTAVGETTERVDEGAYAEVAVKVGRIKILQKEIDLCEEARNANVSVQCPVKAGVYKVVQTVALPKEIPPAPFQVSVDGYTADDEDLICLKLHIDFRRNPFPGRGLLGL